MDFSIATLGNIINKSNDKKTETPGTLDKDAFLQILVTQLQYQDPLSPMDSDAFITQMSQFTMLEQLYNIASAMEGMTQASIFSDAASVVGKEVKLLDQQGKEAAGIVEKVSLANGSIEVQVNGQMYDFMSIYEVKNPDLPDSLPEE